MPLERLKKKLQNEVMWVYILRLLKERPMYAYELKKEIRERFGWDAATVTSYVVLYRLQMDSYVKTKWVESEKGRPARKYYSITQKGRKLLNDGKEFMEEVYQKLFGDLKS